MLRYAYSILSQSADSETLSLFFFQLIACEFCNSCSNHVVIIITIHNAPNVQLGVLQMILACNPLYIKKVHNFWVPAK